MSAFRQGLVTGASAVALLTGALLASAVPAANATGQDGVADWNEMVFAYNSDVYELDNGPTGPNGNGSESDFAANKKDLAGHTFLTLGAGRGQPVKNNSAHVSNDNRQQDGRVYFNSYAVMGCWCGSNDFVGAYTSRDLSVTYNDNASFRWLPLEGVPV